MLVWLLAPILSHTHYRHYSPLNLLPLFDLVNDFSHPSSPFLIFLFIFHHFSPFFLSFFIIFLRFSLYFFNISSILKNFMGLGLTTPYPPQFTKLCDDGVLDAQNPFTAIHTYIGKKWKQIFKFFYQYFLFSYCHFLLICEKDVGVL